MALRKALLRNLTTNLLYHGKIRTTDARAKEIRSMTEKLITLAVKERDNFEEVTITVRVPRKNKDGSRVKKEVDGKRETVYDEVQKTIQRDLPSRLNARRKILSIVYPVTEVPADGRKKRTLSKKVDMAKMMFEDIAPKYVDRKGGYTRITKLGPRKGDGAEEVIIELV